MYDLNKIAPSIRHRILRANLPMKSIGMELSDLDNGPAVDKVKIWLEQVRSGVVIKSPGSPFSGLGLLLVGLPGHGKTTIASVAVQELIRTMPFDIEQPGLFLDYPKFLRLEKSAFEDNSLEDELKKIYGDDRHSIPLFILDDLGKEYKTQAGWSENVFDALIRARFNAGLPTIITTNVRTESWRRTYGEAMASFAHEAFMWVEVESENGDLRK